MDFDENDDDDVEDEVEEASTKRRRSEPDFGIDTSGFDRAVEDACNSLNSFY